MANWAFTSYAIEGKRETVEKIFDAIQKPVLDEDASEGWEGGVLKALDIEWENKKPEGTGYYMRGFIEHDTVYWDGDTLRFDAEEAWGATDFHEVLEKNLSGIKVFFVVEEEGEEIYATNDKEGKYFSDRYYVDTCIDGDYQSEYFETKKDAFKWLANITQGRVKNSDDLDAFNSDYEDSESADENYIYIHEFEIVD